MPTKEDIQAAIEAEQKRSKANDEAVDMTSQNNGGGETTVQNNGGGGVTTQPVVQPPVTSYADMFEKMKAQNDAQRKVDEKKQKRDQIFAAIGDGISALANLYFTTKGAPNSYNPTATMSDRTREMYDKINKDRDERFKQEVNNRMQAEKADNDNRWNITNFGYRQGRDAIADAARERELGIREKQNEEARKAREADQKFKKDEADRHQKNTEAAQAEARRHNTATENINRTQVNNRVSQTNTVTEVTLGDGRFARIPKSRYNTPNIRRVFNALPEEVRKSITEEPVLNERKRPVKNKDGSIMTKPRKVTKDDMLELIQDYIDDPKVQDAWLSVGFEIGSAGDAAGNHSGQLQKDDEDEFAQYETSAKKKDEDKYNKYKRK